MERGLWGRGESTRGKSYSLTVATKIDPAAISGKKSMVCPPIRIDNPRA